MTTKNTYFIVAGCLSLLAALLHLMVIAGGPDWYRFFGAGEQMAQMAARGDWYPTMLTLVITGILATWGLYAFSAAGLMRRLPLMRTILILITFAYVFRAVAGFVIAALPAEHHLPGYSSTFMIWSSAICAVYGVFHIMGLATGWRTLSIKNHQY